jgi:FkbM family methyltransferase
MKCAVVIPIGPGHELLAQDACDSVKHAYRTAAGPFTKMSLIAVDDGRGELGRSAARNQGVAQAVQQGAEWIFFLDADDVMTPHTFAAVGPYVANYDAIWGAISELAGDEESGMLRAGQVSELVQFSQLLANDPWTTIQIGHFVKTSVATALPFNEALNAGEDVDYYLRVWPKFKCIKIAEPLFHNRRGMRSTGIRGATDSDWRIAAQRLIGEACVKHEFHRDFSSRGMSFRFYISNPFDIIQRHHMKGRFFEAEELEYLESRISPGAHIVDVGAHVGNHVVYYSSFMRPRKITVIEPNPNIANLLRRNITSNSVENADLSQSGIAADRREASYRLICPRPENPEAIRLEAANNGEVKSAPLDRLVRESVDMVRIDAGEMEFDVLAGAAGLISAWRPVIMVRVSNKHAADLANWLRRNRYRIAGEFRQVNAVNTVIEPLP